MILRHNDLFFSCWKVASMFFSASSMWWFFAQLRQLFRCCFLYLLPIFLSTCISLCIISSSCVFPELIVALEFEFPLFVLLVLGYPYLLCFSHDTPSETYRFSDVWSKGWILSRTIFPPTWSSCIFSPCVPCTV